MQTSMAFLPDGNFQIAIIIHTLITKLTKMKDPEDNPVPRNEDEKKK